MESKLSFKPVCFSAGESKELDIRKSIRNPTYNGTRDNFEWNLQSVQEVVSNFNFEEVGPLECLMGASPIKKKSPLV